MAQKQSDYCSWARFPHLRRVLGGPGFTGFSGHVNVYNSMTFNIYYFYNLLHFSRKKIHLNYKYEPFKTVVFLDSA